MTLGSLFDGLGGWLIAAKHAGIEPLWSSEIDPRPAAVSAYHFPEVVQLGDVTKIDGAKIPLVDIITSGSPCQSLSLAGTRTGLKGESGLFYEATRIFREMRAATNGALPRFFVWENVPGAFVSNGGQDFRAVLEEIAETQIPMPESGKWANAGLVRGRGCDIAWRVLDAQYFGVPQRRKRIFLVADFTADSRCADKVLFEPDGVQVDTSESKSEGQDIAAGAGDGSVGTVYDITHNSEARPFTGTAPTLAARMGTGGNQIPIALAVRMRAGKPGGGKGPLIQVNRVGTLATHNDQTIYSLQGGGETSGNGHGLGINQDVSYTLNTTDRHGVAYGLDRAAVCGSAYNPVVSAEQSPPLCAKGESGVNACGIVRKLTPIECERLQGLPDNFTLVEFGGKPMSDSARYKMIGNGMAQLCADFVLEGIAREVIAWKR